MRSKKESDGAVNGVGETSMIVNNINDTSNAHCECSWRIDCQNG